jgi:hypothetical protein
MKHVFILLFYIQNKRIYYIFKMKLSLCIIKDHTVTADEGLEV